jgi:Ca2+-binding RTX toxin-like protein
MFAPMTFGSIVATAVLCIGLTALAGPAVAGAAPYAVQTGGPPAPGISAFAQDDRGHELTISYSGGGYVIHDPAGVEAIDTGCQPSGAETVRCADIGYEDFEVSASNGDDEIVFRSVGPTVFTQVDGAGGDDRLVGADRKDQLNGGAGRDRLIGGPGPDGLYGGPGADVLKGGRGLDTMFGGSGADLLLARDGQRDRFIRCQGGPASLERAVRDRVDPAADSC